MHQIVSNMHSRRRQLHAACATCTQIDGWMDGRIGRFVLQGAALWHYVTHAHQHLHFSHSDELCTRWWKKMRRQTIVFNELRHYLKSS